MLQYMTMDKIYMFFSFGFLAVLFYGYSGFGVLMSLILTALSFGVSVAGYIKEVSSDPRTY